MNVKKKIAEAKANLKKYAPHIAITTAVAGTIAYKIYTTVKNTPDIEIETDTPENVDFDINDPDVPGTWEVIAAIAVDDLKRLSENDSYEVSNIDADFFRIKEVNTED